MLLVLACVELILTFYFLHDLLIESLIPRILGILCHLVQCYPKSHKMVWSLMLFEGTPDHLPWSFENEKKSLSYIWKCPSNEKRVTKKNHCRMLFVRFKRQSAILWAILFFDWLPWRDSNTEVWNTPGWKAEYVKNMDHWSKSFISQLHFLPGALCKWTEASLLLMLPQTLGLSVHLQGDHDVSPHRTSMGRLLLNKCF